MDTQKRTKIQGEIKPGEQSIDLEKDNERVASEPETSRPESEIERAQPIFAYLGASKMVVDRTHIKALLKHPETRESMLERLDDTSLTSADIDSLSLSDFDLFHDAALDVFGNGEVPIVKEYLAEGGCGDYPIEIAGIEGAYMVRALEFDDKGLFGTLEEAEEYVGLNWCGQAREQ